MNLYESSEFEKREGILKRKIEECDNIIRKGKKACKDKKELEKQLKDFLSMDLVRDKKILWCDVNLTIFSKNYGWIHNIYVYKTDDGEKYGYWQGENNLSDIESEHFQKYIKDYFYYGGPNYDKSDDASECEMAFENGHSLKQIHFDGIFTRYY